MKQVRYSHKSCKPDSLMARKMKMQNEQKSTDTKFSVLWLYDPHLLAYAPSSGSYNPRANILYSLLSTPKYSISYHSPHHTPSYCT